MTDEKKKKGRGHTGGSPTSKANRARARATQVPPEGLKAGEKPRTFKNTTEARAGGMYLPTKAQRAADRKQRLDVEASSGSPRKDLGKQAQEIVDRERKDPKKR